MAAQTHNTSWGSPFPVPLSLSFLCTPVGGGYPVLHPHHSGGVQRPRRGAAERSLSNLSVRHSIATTCSYGSGICFRVTWLTKHSSDTSSIHTFLGITRTLQLATKTQAHCASKSGPFLCSAATASQKANQAYKIDAPDPIWKLTTGEYWQDPRRTL